jgi:two-component system sensor histidine kinase KdpD
MPAGQRPIVGIALRIAVVLGIVAAVTVICFRIVPVNATTAGFAYLIAVLFVAARWGLTESISGAVAAGLCYNFFFLPPIGTFAIADPQNWVALLVFLSTSITASHLSTQAKRRAVEATERQREMEKLYALSRSILLIEPTQQQVPKQLAMQVAQSLGATAIALYDRQTGETYRSGPEDFPDSTAELEQAAVQGTFFRDEKTKTVITSIRLGAQPIGGLGLKGVELSDSALQGLANLVAIGLERARAQEAASRAEAARQSDELKSTLLDALAHELKTPLTAIKAASTALLSSSALKEVQQRELISIVDEETDRLSILVTEAIQLARIEAGRVQLRRENHSVCELINSVVEKVQPAAAGRQIEVRIPADVPPLWVDRELMEVALRQLIDNAFKYSPPDSAVAVTVSSSDGRVVISVADHGPGIPEAEQTLIFEKFYRAEASRHQIPGAGLGLVIAREIIHVHGGEIWVESKLGEGSVFHVSVPAAGDKASK